MKEIIKKYKQWKSEHDEDYCYDEIGEFFADLDRGEKLDIMEFLIDFTITS
jgi:hypothetical protein